jgi:S-formylglutathione hydrolase FrmB
VLVVVYLVSVGLLLSQTREDIIDGQKLGNIRCSGHPNITTTEILKYKVVGTVDSTEKRTNVTVSAPRIVVVDIPTKMQDSPIPTTLILPSSYYATEDKRTYSVVYLLHGAGDTHKGWAKHTNVASLAEIHDVLVVCPDAGGTSWYFDSPIDPTYQYETFVSKEVVAYVDQQYRTRPVARHRAVMGNSMGGHGAIFLSVRHPDIFQTAISLSGGVDIRPFSNQWDIAKRIGTIEDAPERWDNLTVMSQTKALLSEDTNLSISLVIGTGDFFLDVNRALHQQLIDMRVPHDYMERPGGHSWEFWKHALPYQMMVVADLVNE